MKQEFITYQQALELKELGFDEPCFGWFRSTLIPSNFTEFFLETEFGMNESPSDWVNSNFLDEACSAPLYQQAFRWFREKHDLHSCVAPVYEDEISKVIVYWIWIQGFDSFEDEDINYKTPEEAELACLIKLIEIVKTKQL